MQPRNCIYIIAAILLLNGCSATRNLPETKHQPFTLRVAGGTNKGGIVENTEMTAVDQAPPDAFTGATSRSLHAGVHALVPLKRNAVEAGLVIMHSGHRFGYYDPAASYDGSLDLSLVQCMVPLTYNVKLFRGVRPGGLMEVKLGYVAQYNLLSESGQEGTVPAYDFNRWSHGPTLGITLKPFRLNNGNQIGLYVEGYRGSAIFKDPYNEDDFEMTGSAYVKTGLFFEF